MSLLDGGTIQAVTLMMGQSVGSGRLRQFQPNGFDPVELHVTVEERHYDELEITDHPVEIGTPISDHAFMRPLEVVIRGMVSNSVPAPAGGVLSQLVSAGAALGGTGARVLTGAAATLNSLMGTQDSQPVHTIYGQLITAQKKRVLFTVYTGKRRYKNMLIKSMAVTTEGKSENSLDLTITFREVILAKTSTVDVPLAATNPTDTKRFGSVRDFGQSNLSTVPSTILNFLPTK